jgi:hypothetical protein
MYNRDKIEIVLDIDGKLVYVPDLLIDFV